MEAQLKPYNPTFRERSTQYVANFLRDKFGMDNYRSYDLARDIFGDESSPTMLGSMGIADFTPAGAIFGGQEGARMYQRSDDLVGKGLGGLTVGLSALEAFPMTALMAKGVKRVFPKGAANKVAPDLEKRKTIQGIAALPVMATGATKVLSDLPMGAVTKTAKALPNVTGSKLLDSIPFIRDKLSKVYENSFYSPQKITDEEKLTQNYMALSDLEDTIKGRAPNLDTKLSELPVTGKTPKTQTAFKYDFDEAGNFGKTDIPEDMDAKDHMELMQDITADSFIEANPNITVREALETIHKEGRDTFRKLIDATPDDSFMVSNPKYNYDDSAPMELTGKEAKEAALKTLNENPNTPVADLWFDTFLQGVDPGMGISRTDIFEGGYNVIDNAMKALKDAE